MAKQAEEQKKMRELNPALNNPFTAHAATMNMDGLMSHHPLSLEVNLCFSGFKSCSHFVNLNDLRLLLYVCACVNDQVLQEFCGLWIIILGICGLDAAYLLLVILM